MSDRRPASVVTSVRTGQATCRPRERYLAHMAVHNVDPSDLPVGAVNEVEYGSVRDPLLVVNNGRDGQI
jgi:hypothetical protein